MRCELYKQLPEIGEPPDDLLKTKDKIIKDVKNEGTSE
jgi:hypothetical protein